MSRAEQFIQDCTRNCSNIEFEYTQGDYTSFYHPWLTPDQAKRAMEIAREEMIDEACEWLKNWAYFSVDDTTDTFDEDDLVRRFRKAMEKE